MSRGRDAVPQPSVCCQWPAHAATDGSSQRRNPFVVAGIARTREPLRAWRVDFTAHHAAAHSRRLRTHLSNTATLAMLHCSRQRAMTIPFPFSRAAAVPEPPDPSHLHPPVFRTIIAPEAYLSAPTAAVATASAPDPPALHPICPRAAADIPHVTLSIPRPCPAANKIAELSALWPSFQYKMASELAGPRLNWADALIGCAKAGE